MIKRRKADVNTIFGHKIRVRVCGILVKNGAILLVKHRGVGKSGTLLSPPGGAMKFGETAPSCLIREFREESGLEIKVGEFLCITEFIDHPLHAIEIFFFVKKVGGKLTTGFDPEMSYENQIIENVEFVRFEELKTLPDIQLHSVLHGISSALDFVQKEGYSYISDKESK